jgi:hypothetical protein
MIFCLIEIISAHAAVPVKRIAFMIAFRLFDTVSEFTRYYHVILVCAIKYNIKNERVDLVIFI